MDGVSAAASIGQLVDFGGTVTMTLIRLIRDISRGPVLYQNEETNVRHLLLLVRRISTEKQQDRHAREFLELFARVDAAAQKILQLLRGTSSSLRHRVVSAITRHRALAEAFRALHAMRELLHFHVSCTLSRDVRACLGAGTRQGYKHLEIEGVESPESPEDCPAQGLTRETPRSSQPRRQARFEIVGNKTGYNALVDIGDDIVVERCRQSREPEQGPIVFKDNETRDYATLKMGNVARRDFNETLAAHRSAPMEAAQSRRPFSGSGQTPGDRAEDYDGVPQLADLVTELPCIDRRNLRSRPNVDTGTSRRNGWQL
ncbi:hypothetical protein PG985_005213 [Apiospora marii]|uniref:Uncharacterized protein n=1 Tax=Apiospora marii TaxID=335849 RepID=A0ABR1SBB1_9PEZI